ncbi:acyl-CoA dehydrogenase family protein [Verticiella alkaliphila]|uniref:acyl-CoA dehydrogenase family protein n=1 Tax=Verticiella alkaliphila TaxID=2779529 RepID=UPI001C0E7A94
MNATGLRLEHPPDVFAKLRRLIEDGLDGLPRPGSGRTLERWRALAAVAERDLTLAKLFESHVDAIAILRELEPDHPDAAPGLWAVWCAEPPAQRVMSRARGADGVRLDGIKAWCSGAAHVDHALISTWDDEGRPQLVQVATAQPGVRVGTDGWAAVGMAQTATVDVAFDGAVGVRVGAPGEYVSRPGFLHGGAGVAACWYGGACALAAHVRRNAQQRPEDAHALAHLGAIDVALAQARALLREAAHAIDATPWDPCAQAVQRARLAVEAAAETVLHRAPRAVGAGPMCKDATFARMMADLPVFIRQSHAERDLAALGLALSPKNLASPWTL